MNKETLREFILLDLAAVAPNGLAAETELHFLRKRGFPQLDLPMLAAELDYLQQKKFLRAEPSAVAAGIVYWKLDAAGREYLEAKGLC